MSTTEAPARHPVPPPGPSLSFAHWTQAVHRAVVQYVPDAVATGTGRGVMITHRPGRDEGARTMAEIVDSPAGTLTVRIVPERSLWWVSFDGGDGRFVMPSLCIERHDDLTARCVAETIAGFLDASQSTPRKKR